ncbi:hypothetical protein K4F52_003135 [Lecanicillium sp. MT-2017a]|nr:hypothetical protein K4F52_003135 [Lecanicillium sp. MT-2017a]
MVRGAIIPLITKKTLMLSSAVVDDSAAATLMSTDMEAILTGIPDIQDVWASYAEVALGLYLLHGIIGESTFTVLVPVLASSIIGYGLGKLHTLASVTWHKRIEERISQTVKVLSQMKGMKMVGLESAISAKLQNLRIKETAAFKKVRALGVATSFIGEHRLHARPYLMTNVFLSRIHIYVDARYSHR